MMMSVFLARLWDVLMGIVVGVPRTLVLEVLLVVVGALVLPSRRLSLSDLRVVLSQPLVYYFLLLNRIDVHICNR